MARGKKTDMETIYTVMVSYASTNSYSETGRLLDMPHTTVEKIVKDNKDKPEFVKLWVEKKEDFAEKATKIIDKVLIRLDKELDMQETIPVNQLSTVLGTMYDKRALARGEATTNQNITVRVELTDE